jgi:hypothetical protein
MRKLTGLAFAASLAGVAAFGAPAYAADPEGSYSIEGTNPGGGGNYTGTVTVRKTGETYSVIWVVGGTRYIGTGIGNKEFIAVSYRSGNNTGLALYGEDGGNWTGIWTYAGGKQVGAEHWSRQ